MGLVLLNNELEMEDLTCITTDQYGGAALAMRHLIEKGHRRIGLLAGNFSPHVYMSRYNAYRDVLTENGCEIDPQLIKTIEPTVEDAIKCTQKLLALEDRPTALFCTNDTIAIGAMKAIMRAGLRIPEDIAVIGYDDSENSRMIEPELTTVQVDKTAMGRIAAERLIALIEGEAPRKETIQTTVKLVVRKST